MNEYVLTYGQPRFSTDGSRVIYEKKFLRVSRHDDGLAIHWASEVVPFQFGLTHSGKQYRAVPMLLSCAESRAKTMIWERDPKMALRMAGSEEN